ncbi:MAG: hypothetical protein IPK12_08390 [Gemmatimonadetes bacterium]|nr:hypothetical protein [Gemmatimonadota bacterium]
MRPSHCFWLVACLAACGTEPQVPPLPDGAVAFVPDSTYPAYWAQMEACSGKRGSFTAVHWYYVPGFDPFPAPGVKDDVVGYWHPSDNRIVLLQNVPNPPALIRHEMLHALIRRTDHPTHFFVDLCGETIAGPPLPMLRRVGG